MSSDIAAIVSQNLEVWTSAVEQKASTGRVGGGNTNLYGIDRLRALILDLAVRGQLVPQDAEDEPAGELLARVRGEREEKIKAKFARKPRKFAPLPDGLPALPTGWVWTQFGAIAEISPKNFADDDVSASFVPMALVSTRIDGHHEAETRKWGDIKKGFTQFAEGDLGLAKITPCFENGKAAIFQNLENGIGAGTTELHVARPWSDELNRRYLLLTMKTASYLANGEKQMTGTAGQKRVTRSYFESTAVPLPPLAEQGRIVAKVDELMALCDELEARSAMALKAHQTLVETLLATLVNSADATNLATNWVRLESNFDTIFTTDGSIDALEQAVLELATRGKLLPPDMDDTPASELIDSWKDAKKVIIDKGEDRRAKTVPSPSQPPFAIPEHWVIESFENIFLFVDYRGKTPPKTTEGIPLITAKNVRMGFLDREPREYISPSTFDEWMTRGFPEIGDLFFTTEAPLGNVCLNDIEEPFAIAQRLICFKPYGLTNTRFFMYVIMSASMQAVLDDHATGMTAKGIKAAKLKPLALPVPPEKEQERIVARVDELLDLCAALRARIADAANTKRSLADSIVERAVA